MGKDLFHLVKILPEDELKSAIDFIIYLIHKNKSTPKISTSELMGKYTHLDYSTDKFMKEKQEEIEVEEEKHRRIFQK